MIMRWIRKGLRPLLFSLTVLLIAVHASSWHEIAFLQKLEWLAYDARMKWAASDERDERIVIIDVDEKSLREKGCRRGRALALAQKPHRRTVSETHR